MNIVRSGFRDDVDHSACSTAELGAETVANYLKFLNAFLADRRLHAARGVQRLSAVNLHHVAAPIISSKRESRLRGLRDAKIRGICDIVGIDYSRREQRIIQEITPVDRKIGDLLGIDHR